MNSARISLLTLLVASITAVTLCAEEQRPQKIGVVKLSRVFEESQKALDASKELEKEMNKRAQKIQEQVQELQKLETELRNKDKSKWSSESARESKAEEYMKLQKNIEIAQQAAQAYFERNKQEITSDIIAKVGKICESLASKLGFDLILPAEQVLFVSPALDITNEILAELNKEYKKSKEPAPLKASPKAA